MAGAGHAPDAAAVDLAVRALCSAGRLDDACGLVRHAALRTDPRPAPPDAYTYNFLVRRLSRSRPVSAVYAFIEELRRDAGLRPDLVTYTILIDAVCRSGNLREAVRLLGVLTDAGFKPDCYLYNTIMKGYCMMDECGGVMEVYNRMRDEGVEPDLARKFLSVMAEMGHFPDTITYTALMSGMCRKGDASGALGLLGEMEQKGCEPNECTYNTLLMGLCKAKCLDKAVELYGMMTAGGMKVDSPAYATFVRALCRANRVAEAYEVFDYAVGSKSLMDVAAYMALENSLKWLRKGRSNVKVEV
ncbi:Pentatricopeptide repeat-containing protein [Ananas comosus]|uniref:Pentatricopeptide repeat-containing protein n=1 Tax=Ananas comosus TaxID=4615 RepID=A0A199W7D9_ANACO|nr:Pentatricopeptide repeat-containing protein [Ananas comosus]